MNDVIENAFSGFKVNNVSIPVKYLYYKGQGEPYVTYAATNNTAVFTAEDQVQNYVTYYDFDIYSKGNYYPIEQAIKNIMKANNFMYVPSQDSAEMYEPDTGYYHKTLCFGIERS